MKIDDYFIIKNEGKWYICIEDISISASISMSGSPSPENLDEDDKPQEEKKVYIDDFYLIVNDIIGNSDGFNRREDAKIALLLYAA